MLDKNYKEVFDIQQKRREESTDLEDKLRKKYPLHMLETYFEKIENLGYSVSMGNDSCQVYNELNHLIIDSDFYSDFHTNAAAMIECFFFDK